MKTMASEMQLVVDPEDQDMVWVKEYPEDPGELYRVIQRGFWWWKSFDIAFFIPSCGVPSFEDGWWDTLRGGFKTIEEARAALHEGEFPLYS